MKRKNTTRNALFTSIISLLLCVSMLVGTTFAWFTDEVKSGTNVIAAGNLDVELYHSNSNTSGNVDESTILFVNKNGEDIRWEPGAMAYETLTVKNEGSLALKYNLAMNLTNENFVVEADGTVTPYGLSNALKIGMIPGELADDVAPEDVLKQVTKWNALKSFQLTGTLEAHTAAEAVTFVIYWEPSDNDNNWNVNNGKTVTDNFKQNGEYALHIDLGVHLKATQQVSESDSFGPEYDKLAPWTGEVSAVPAEVNGVITITTGAELAALAADVNSGNSYEGKTIQLGADINLNDVAWTPIGTSACPFKGTFIGTGYTISNLYAVGKDGVGLFGRTYVGAHIEGVTVVNAYVYGNDRVGVIVGGGYLAANCIKDCTVMNAVVTATPYMTDDGKTYDGGAKAGVIIGQAYNGSITGCTAKDASVTAYRDLGGISGMLYADGVTGRTLTASGNTVENVTLTYLDLNGAAYDKNTANESMGDVVGRLGRSSDKCNMPVVENNTVTNVTRNTVITWVEDGVQYTKDVDTGVVTLFAITDAFVGDTLNVPSGVTNLRNKLLNGNTTIKEVVLPATLTNFGGSANGTEAATGGFFYKSAVEKITLPEGLTEIPAGAFNQAANLKEVNIPSSVTTIGIGAFGGTGLTELNIPATVTTIGGGAFRDMANLTTVTINGTDVNIPKYAFRACAKLTTVILNVDSLTLGDGMVFTNTSTNNENPNNITIYVKNDSMYNTLTSNSDVKCTVVKATFVTNADELQTALDAATGDATILLGADITGNVIATQKEGVNITINGIGHEFDGAIEIYGQARATGAETLTIKNINFVSDVERDFVHCNTTESAKRYAHNVTIEDCTFTGSGNGDVVAARFRQCYNITVKNCSGTGLHSVLWATGVANGITVDNVTASCTSGGVSFGTSTDVTVKNSNFTVAGAYGYGIRVDASGAYKLKVENCVITADAPVLVRKATGAATVVLTGNTLTSAKGNTLVVTAADYAAGTELTAPTGNLTITVDGTPWVCNAAQLAAAVANGATDIYLMDGVYDVYSCGGKTLTLSGSKNAVLKLYNEGEDGCDYGFDGSTVTFNGVTIDTSANNGNYKGFARLNATFNNCAISGSYTTHNVQTFNNCTFNTNNGYIWIWGAEKVTFNGCTFEGNSKAILAHGWASSVININNCDFVATEQGYTGSGDNTAAIEIDPAGSNTYTINFTGKNTITDSYAGWTRVKDGSTGHVTTEPKAVNNAANLQDSVSAGNNVVLTDDVTAPLSGSAIYGTPVAVVQKNGGVIDGNGNALDIENPQYNGYAIETWGGRIQNLIIDTAVGRGIVISSPKEDIYIDNVVIDGPGYAINTTEYNGKALYVSNSTVKGWTSLAGLNSISFTNCTFGENTSKYWQNMGYGQDYDRLIRPYASATFTGCTFEQDYYLDLSALGADCTVTLTDCVCNGVVITAENYDEYITVELPSGRTLSDCVIFN